MSYFFWYKVIIEEGCKLANKDLRTLTSRSQLLGTSREGQLRLHTVRHSETLAWQWSLPSYHLRKFPKTNYSSSHWETEAG